MKYLILLTVIVTHVFMPQLLRAQVVPRAAVKGRVLDDSTRAPLPLANVFVSNSTIGTATKGDGTFELKGVPLGTHQVVASIVGYQPESVTLQLTDSIARTIEFRLKARPVQMAAVEVEARNPVEWRKQLDHFLKVFFGTTPNSSSCRLMNPQVLDFKQEDERDPFVATAREPLEIENRALGYHFRCVMIHFSESEEMFQFAGLTAFTDLKPGDEQESEQWKANRRDAFFGSKRHFLVALVRKSVKRDGFEVSSIQQRWIHRALERPAGYEVNADTLISPGEVSFETKFSFPHLLQVIYTHDHEQRISVIELGRPWAIVYPNGLTQDPLGVRTYGYWSTQRAAEMLPLDYEPE